MKPSKYDSFFLVKMLKLKSLSNFQEILDNELDG